MDLESALKTFDRSGLLTAGQLMLLKQAMALLAREEQAKPRQPLSDYGFVIFSAAKAYEGFLKSFFYQLGLISRQQYGDEHWRIGRALNPDLPYRLRDETWLYDDVATTCGEKTARLWWETWRTSRNQVFHYFPDHDQWVTLGEARRAIEMIMQAIQTALVCDGRRKWLE
ncbi:hypothetical protein A2W24_06350 [Microgenomates group bacterium RBG_16_45_19]|nr:MAG: hypothetical protein A2W24_06350 [Microgenomates group bacterium RBG_16_45_19]